MKEEYKSFQVERSTRYARWMHKILDARGPYDKRPHTFLNRKPITRR